MESAAPPGGSGGAAAATITAAIPEDTFTRCRLRPEQSGGGAATGGHGPRRGRGRRPRRRGAHTPAPPPPPPPPPASGERPPRRRHGGGAAENPPPHRHHVEEVLIAQKVRQRICSPLIFQIRAERLGNRLEGRPEVGLLLGGTRYGGAVGGRRRCRHRRAAAAAATAAATAAAVTAAAVTVPVGGRSRRHVDKRFQSSRRARRAGRQATEPRLDARKRARLGRERLPRGARARRRRGRPRPRRPLGDAWGRDPRRGDARLRVPTAAVRQGAETTAVAPAPVPASTVAQLFAFGVCHYGKSCKIQCDPSLGRPAVVPIGTTEGGVRIKWPSTEERIRHIFTLFGDHMGKIAMSLTLAVIVLGDILWTICRRRSPSLAVTRPPPTEHATSC